MILDNIAFTNFGLYAGHQQIPLTPPSPDKPVILFGGLNGGGKTTFLDALQLCLFGAHAKTSNRGRLGYSEYLSRCIHSHAEHNSASIQLSFRHTIEGTEDRYTLKRSWTRANGRCTEEFNVLKNDRLAPSLADNWASQVEDLMPANIAHLFLFDGEQIERYASPADSASLVGTAIQNLLGLDVVDQLEKDMRVFERRKKSEQLDNAARAKVAAAEAELQTLRDRIDRAKQDRAALRTHRIERRRLELQAVNEEFRRIGGNLFEQRQDIEATLAGAELAAAESSEALRELASGSLPLLLVSDLLQSAAARDQEDRDIAQARQLHDLLNDRDRAVLAHLKANAVDTASRTLLRDYLEKDRVVHQERAARNTSLDLPHEARRALTALLHGQMDDLQRTAIERLARHSHVQSEVEQARNVHHSVPQMDAVADVIRRRDTLRDELSCLDVEDASIGREIERLVHDTERAERALTVLMEADVRDRERRDDRTRMVCGAARVRETLATFRAATIERHVARIEHLVLESYQHLLRKTSLVTRLSIHPETFSLTLFGRTGDVLSAESLSAGERQLLGIALLWGLAKASGRPLPTAIDTPLGRLDTDHRRHFVEHYVPFASHQTLLFSTNEEIVGDYLERLSPSIGRCYYLDHDDQRGCTHVTPGYFEGERVTNGH